MAKQITFQFKELAAVLARESGVRKGHWGLYVRFGLGAGNVPQSQDELFPAAIVPIVELGIQEFEAPNSLTVDAATLDAKTDEEGAPEDALLVRPDATARARSPK
ncbi:MAG TPA: hypothetical protein VJU18_09475 [Vicinamibacteria bacterium]|nr:hypothetical protein [Vicinamibacteria bacterium]